MFKSVVSALVISAFASSAAVAQELPSGPMRMLVPFSAGGSTDILARLLAKEMGTELDRTIVVENKPGAEGFIAARDLQTAKPDGRTIMMVTTSVHSINPAIFAKLPYDTSKDFTTVSVVASSPNVFLVPADSPFKTISDLVDAAKQEDESVAYATGATMHLLNVKWLETLSSSKMNSIPYKGSAAAYPDLIAQRVDFMVDQPVSSMSLIKDGQLRVLAVSSDQRWSQLPEVATVAEQGFPSFNTSSWWAILAPSGTPEETVQLLHDAAQKVLNNPEVQEKVAQLGADVGQMSLSEAQAFTDAELVKWKKIASDAKFQVD